MGQNADLFLDLTSFQQNFTLLISETYNNDAIPFTPCSDMVKECSVQHSMGVLRYCLLFF
jgi:hypothetical protein